jgi:hypothetical protein
VPKVSEVTRCVPRCEVEGKGDQWRQKREAKRKHRYIDKRYDSASSRGEDVPQNQKRSGRRSEERTPRWRGDAERANDGEHFDGV